MLHQHEKKLGCDVVHLPYIAFCQQLEVSGPEPESRGCVDTLDLKLLSVTHSATKTEKHDQS